jgi:TIR domain
MAGMLKNHLGQLKRNERITIWDQGKIGAGEEWKQAMATSLQEAQIILLLISRSFLASDYCYTIQMQEAIRRHEQQAARVIPIILRSAYWQEPPLDKLKVLPDEQKPIAEWKPQDKGYTNVVLNIAQVVKQWNEHSLPGPTIERKAVMLQLDQLIEQVKGQLQPEPRALATANTLQQLSIFIPTAVTLADLVVGWRILSQAPQTQEDIAVTRRRITCGELATLASQLTSDQGKRAQAIKTWQAWRTAFEKSDDPRQSAMASTFARELSELQTVAP